MSGKMHVFRPDDGQEIHIVRLTKSDHKYALYSQTWVRSPVRQTGAILYDNSNTLSRQDLLLCGTSHDGPEVAAQVNFPGDLAVRNSLQGCHKLHCACPTSPHIPHILFIFYIFLVCGNRRSRTHCVVLHRIRAQ